MKPDIWMLFFFAYLVITISPGPNVLAVVKNATAHGYFAAMTTILGNLTCQLIIVVAVAFGAGTLLTKIPTVFLVYKLVGGAYLIYLGMKALVSRQKRLESAKVQTAPQEKPNFLRIFRNGFAVSAANPKTIIFLSAFLPQFIQAGESLLAQFATMYVTIALIVFCIHLLYCVVAKSLLSRFIKPVYKVAMSKLSGIVFIVFGGRIVFGSAS
ncbi:LysE family translocator [Reinekea sp. G2M2-21]|uniref:LysE family translocator n=1 Tax=Reinekea sp. G2M2-21 TaxID=2788942 RepID=UPI0018AA69EF|nr:LysE family translocator [Reinekea sp. G2M2-21]